MVLGGTVLHQVRDNAFSQKKQVVKNTYNLFVLNTGKPLAPDRTFV